MTFPALSFDRMNEADVREEVLAPLIRALGYQSGTEADVIREQSLRYPRVFLGRKDLKKDPELRGKADYVLDVGKLVRWVIEAKAPSLEIGTDDIEQGWTYASHPEIRAIYFVLCNGRSLHVFQTLHGPAAPAILVVPYEQFEDRFQVMSDLLGPTALQRDYPKRLVEIAPPIGPGLRSVARITSGLMRIETNSLKQAKWAELQTGISGGAIERDERGCLVAYIETVASMRSIQALNEKLGYTSIELTSEDGSLSVNPDRPTVLRANQRFTLPKGEPILDVFQWKTIVLPESIDYQVETFVSGVLRGHDFVGRFSARMRFLSFSEIIVDLEGPFHLHVI